MLRTKVSSQKWPVIVVLGAAPPGLVLLVFKYKVTKIDGLLQQTAIVSEFEGCTVKVGRAKCNCDITMVIANGLIIVLACFTCFNYFITSSNSTQLK